jgi:hypothetical protein
MSRFGVDAGSCRRRTTARVTTYLYFAPTVLGWTTTSDAVPLSQVGLWLNLDLARMTLDLAVIRHPRHYRPATTRSVLNLGPHYPRAQAAVTEKPIALGLRALDSR